MIATGASDGSEQLPADLSILLLEDSVLDAELTCASLGIDGGCRIDRVEDQQSFQQALEERHYDLILADYSLPSFDGITALDIAQRLRPDTPFIFVSGALGEELAIETLKRGAMDYVLKHRLERLRPSVLRALREKEERRQRQLAEDLLRKQGEPSAYITGREAGGAFIAGIRYGSGTLHHQIEGDRRVYWTGPSVGFDFGANADKVFVLVYNLHDSQRLFRRYPAAEGNAYVVGGFTASYLRRGDIVLIPVRVGIGARLGVNAGYMRFSQKTRWLPF